MQAISFMRQTAQGNVVMRRAPEILRVLLSVLLFTIGMLRSLGAQTDPVVPLPDGVTSKAYSVQLAANGAEGSLHWIVSAGNLPPGLQLSQNGGVVRIEGVPAEFQKAPYVFEVTASDNSHEGTQRFSILVKPIPVRITAVASGAAAATTIKPISITVVQPADPPPPPSDQQAAPPNATPAAQANNAASQAAAPSPSPAPQAGAAQQVAAAQNAAQRKVTSITVTPSNPIVVVNSTVHLTATAFYDDKTHEDVSTSATWKLTPDTFATIDPAGVVTGTAQGSVTVTATYDSLTSASAVVTVKNPSSMYTLGLIGLNATGSAASGVSQQYFAEFNLIAPVDWLGSKACGDLKQTQDPLSRRCWLWLDPRVASVPSSTSSALNSLSTSSLTTGIGTQTVAQIVQTFEIQTGFEYTIRTAASGTYWGSGSGPWGRSAISLILGGGLVTPFSSTASSPQFQLNSNLAAQFVQYPSLITIYPQLADGLCSWGLTSSPSFTCPSTPSTKPTAVSFVVPNRSRFYRDYYGGLRFRFFYAGGDCGNEHPVNCVQSDIFPGTVDVRLGQDETVTGGKLRGAVLTFSGSFAIPGTGGTVRLFGSSYLRMHKNVNTPALVLIPTSPVLTLDNPALIVQQTNRSDQDYFRLGIGFDIFPILDKLKSAAPAKATTAPK